MLMQSKLIIAIVLLLFVSVARGQTPVIDSLQKIIAQNKRDSIQVNAYVRLSDEFARVNIAAAKRSSRNAMLLSRQLNTQTPLSAAYSQLVTLNAQTNQPDIAKYYLGLLKKLADENKQIRIQSNYNLT